MSMIFNSKLIVITLTRDAKSPIFGWRLPYLDVHYGLPYGRTYISFFHFLPMARRV